MNPDKLLTMAAFVADLTKYHNSDINYINSIHELNQIMNTTKITNQATMHDTVRNKQFIVGSFQPATGLSFAAIPTVQYSAAQARSECKRLAKMYPGRTFVYVQLQGAEMTVPQPTTVSI